MCAIYLLHVLVQARSPQEFASLLVCRELELRNNMSTAGKVSKTICLLATQSLIKDMILMSNLKFMSKLEGIYMLK